METSTQALGDLLSNIRSLAPLPGGVARLMALVPTAPGYYEEAVTIVRADPALATQALKIANSAMYAGQTSVSTVDRALMRVGARMIATTLAEGHLRRSFDIKDEVSAHLWLLNATKANLAFELAQKHAVGVAPEAAYTYGLLHDVGRLVLASLWRNSMRDIVEDDPSPRDELLRREEEECGVTHAVAGRLLGNRWKLPSDVVLVVAAHHFDRSARTSYPPEINRAIELVALVDDAVHAAARGSATPEDAGEAARARFEDESRASSLQAVGVTARQIGDAIRPALAAVARQRKALGIGAAASAGRLPV